MGEWIRGGTGPWERGDDLQVGSRDSFFRAFCGEVEGLLTAWCNEGCRGVLW